MEKPLIVRGMKILHIKAGGTQGGAEIFSLDAIKSLHERGIEQHVICKPNAETIAALEARNIPYTLLGFKRLTKWFEQKTILRVIKDFQPDLIHSWMRRASSFIPARLDVPVLGWFGGPYDIKNYKTCDYYMGVTRDVVAHINDSTGMPDRAFVGHTFGTLDEDPPITRADIGVPDGVKMVLLLSRMHWTKAIDTLLYAAQKCSDDVHFVLAGDGPDMEKFQAMANDLGLRERVHFLGWRTDRLALLRITDICALPSRSESFGTVIAESWYAGVPLVASKADGARQYVTHDSDGLLCEIDDVDGLVTQLERALNDDALCKTIVAGGIKTYNELFSKEIVTDKLISDYTHMIKTGKPLDKKAA